MNVKELGGVVDDIHVRITMQVKYACPNFGSCNFKEFVRGMIGSGDCQLHSSRHVLQFLIMSLISAVMRGQ